MPIALAILAITAAPIPEVPATPVADRATVTATMATATPTIDGQIIEPAWTDAPVFRDFVQSYPHAGAAPSERTEARVLYDRDNLYVAVVCYQPPDQIVAPLATRDRLPTSDLVSVGIDPDRDGKSAVVFAVNAAGVLMDSLLFDDSKVAVGWDAVWEAASARRADGWSAELRIPLRLLRLPAHAAPTLGFLLRRVVAHTREEIDSAIVPRDQAAVVSRYGALTGVQARARQGVELTPYVASGAARDGGEHRSRASADLGLDLRWQSAGGWALTAALNPDFGQVETDELIANFGSQELARPEKRPFFTEGLDLFAPADADYVASHKLFYSRRIGLDTPIAGAAKLTGTAGPLEVAGFAAVVSPARPLHVGAGPADPAATTGFAAAALRASVTARAQVRASAVAVQPFTTPSCAEADCRRDGALTAAVGGELRSASGDWGALGQLDGSALTTGPAAGRVLLDGTQLRPGDLGLGATLRAGKLEGAPWRYQLRYRAASPRLELNTAGLLPQQNEHYGAAELSYLRPEGVGALLGLEVGVRVQSAAAARPFGLVGSGGVAYGELTLPGFHRVRCESGGFVGRVDRREIRAAGVRLERPPFAFTWCQLTTDDSATLALQLSGYVGRSFAAPSSPARVAGGSGATVVWRPAPRLETTLAARFDSDVDGPRWVETEHDVATFGALRPRSLSVVLRQSLVLSPRMSLSSYAQLFTESRRFGQLFTAPIDDDLVTLAELSPTRGPDPSTHDAALVLSASLRWEYRLGSLLQLTYSRHQREPSPRDDQPPARTLGVGRLGAGPAQHELQFKLSYYWGS